MGDMTKKRSVPYNPTVPYAWAAFESNSQSGKRLH